MDPIKVGNAIKTLRLQANYTQHSLAECLGVTDQAVSKWERGLSVPDVSIVTRLSILLNVDVDNLLEGNITFIEKTWQGLLVLEENDEIFSGSEVYGKPLVDIFLSYFMLAGIGNIYIVCSEKDRKYIEERIGDGSKYGINTQFLIDDKQKIQMDVRNTMVVYNNPFVYGPNLTKYFQRAMSRSFGISVLTVSKTIGGREIMVAYDNHKAVTDIENGSMRQYCAPILFFPKKFFDQINPYDRNVNISTFESLYAEPMGNGMIEYSILDEDSLWDTSSFLRYLKKQMGKEIYDLKEIANNRNFLKKE